MTTRMIRKATASTEVDMASASITMDLDNAIDGGRGGSR